MLSPNLDSKPMPAYLLADEDVATISLQCLLLLHLPIFCLGSFVSNLSYTQNGLWSQRTHPRLTEQHIQSCIFKAQWRAAKSTYIYIKALYDTLVLPSKT